jgi:hypothetical protein
MYENVSFAQHHHNAWKSEGGEKHRKSHLQIATQHQFYRGGQKQLTGAFEHDEGQNRSQIPRRNKSVPLEDVVPDEKVSIEGNLSKTEETELIETLAKNKDIFAWSASDLMGVSRDIIQHSLDINPKI